MGQNNVFLKARAFYFLFYAAGASLLPFLAIYYDSLGLNGRQIGLLTGLPPLITLFAAPLWGGLADITQKQKLLQFMAVFGAVASALVLGRTENYFWLLLVIGFYALFAAPIMPLFDNSVMDLLGNRRNLYGRQRVWGAVGWGLFGPIIGILIERSGLKWPFWGYAVLLSVGLIVIWRMPPAKRSTQDSFRRGFRTLFTNRAWTVFLGMVFVVGMGFAIIFNFLFLQLDSLGASKTLMGFSLTAATISEIPVLYFSGRLLSRFGSRGLLIIAVVALIIRFVGYSYLTVVWPVLIIQLLHGPTFAAMWVAGVSYADEIAPPGLGATAQGLFSGILLGLGAWLGALLGGIAYDVYGPEMMYRLYAVLATPVLLVFYFWSRNASRVELQRAEK